MHEGIILNEVGIVSTYLPDIEKSLESYICAVEQLHHLCSSLSSKGAKFFVIGGDMQVELPPDCDDMTGPCARGQPCSKQHWDRVNILLEFMRSFGLKAVNTWASDEKNFVTRVPWGKTRAEGRQLDYILATQSLQSSSGVHVSSIFRSDHLAVWASLRGPSLGFTRRDFKRNMKGWAPVDSKASE
jgi:exonuclease III